MSGELNEKVLENRVRRKAARLGCRVIKSRQWKHVPNLYNNGEYMLLDNRGFPLGGHAYNASLEEIEDWLDPVEASS
jgi:hypothetical protein